jgi:hypothetical protein
MSVSHVLPGHLTQGSVHATHPAKYVGVQLLISVIPVHNLSFSGLTRVATHHASHALVHKLTSVSHVHQDSN